MDFQQKYQEVCRACMRKSKEMKKIFNSEVESVPISQMLSFVTPINLRPDDGLPLSICYFCLNRLVGAYKFQQMCIDSDLRLRSELKRLNNIRSSSPDILEEIKSGATDGIPVDSFDEDDDEIYELTSVPLSTTTKNQQQQQQPQHQQQNMSVINKKMPTTTITKLNNNENNENMVLKFECDDENEIKNEVIDLDQDLNQDLDQNLEKNDVNNKNNDEGEVLITIETASNDDDQSQSLNYTSEANKFLKLKELLSSSSSSSIITNNNTNSTPKISSAISLASQLRNPLSALSSTSSSSSSATTTTTSEHLSSIIKLKETGKTTNTGQLSSNPSSINQQSQKNLVSHQIFQTDTNKSSSSSTTPRITVRRTEDLLDNVSRNISNSISNTIKTTTNNDDGVEMKIVAFVCSVCKMVFTDKSKFTIHKNSKCPRKLYREFSIKMERKNRNYSDEDLQKAIFDIKEKKFPYRKASEIYNIPLSTLFYKATGHQQPKKGKPGKSS